MAKQPTARTGMRTGMTKAPDPAPREPHLPGLTGGLCGRGRAVRLSAGRAPARWRRGSCAASPVARHLVCPKISAGLEARPFKRPVSTESTPIER